MDTPFTSASSEGRLYAFYLKLRPLQRGSLMAFNGELVHAAWLDWLRSAAPDVAAWLHDGNKRRVFTCSSLQFPLSPRKMQEAERHNVHLPLDPEKTYAIRVTLLLGELFPFFYDALMNVHRPATATAARRPPFIQLGKQVFLLEEIVGGREDQQASGWTGYTSFDKLYEEIKDQKPGKTESLSLEFDSLTTFSRGTLKYKDFGKYHALLPLPHYVFPYLARRWNELAPPHLAGIVQEKRIEDYALDEGIIITDYDLRSHVVKFTTHSQPGFIGKCRYTLRGYDDPPSEEAPLTIRQQIMLLAQFSFYCGVGYKTAMGMGRTRRI